MSGVLAERVAAKAKIEAMVARMLARLSALQDPTVDLPGAKPLFARDASGAYSGARDLLSLLRVLRQSYELLAADPSKPRSITSRGLYYLSAEHWTSQAEANATVKKALEMLQVSRHALGVLAAARGWYAGAVHVVEEAAAPAPQPGGPHSAATSDAFAALDSSALPEALAAGLDDVVDDGWPSEASAPATYTGGAAASYGSGSGGAAAEVLVAATTARHIPAESVHTPPRLRNAGAQFILVVEKEAVFRRLVEDRMWERPGLRCIIVTGCGFPDHATRAFLHYCWRTFNLPVYGLSDWNPFGLTIMLCYRDGSKASRKQQQASSSHSGSGSRSRAAGGAGGGAGAAAAATASYTDDANPWADLDDGSEPLDTRDHRVPLRWLGLRHHDIAAFSLPRTALQSLSRIDENRINGLVRSFGGGTTAQSSARGRSQLAGVKRRRGSAAAAAAAVSYQSQSQPVASVDDEFSWMDDAGDGGEVGEWQGSAAPGVWPEHADSWAEDEDEDEDGAARDGEAARSVAAMQRECQQWLATRSKMELEGIMSKGVDFFVDVYLRRKLAAADWV